MPRAVVLGDRSPAPQVHVELAVGETVDDAVGPAHGQRGLADSGGTDDHGAAAARAEQPVQLVQMPVPSGEADDVGRQLRRGRAGSRWRREARVVAQDRDLQLAQHGTRLDPEVVAKLRGQPPEGFERLGRATAPVQSEHLRADQALAARMLGDQRGQFTGQLDMPTELEFGLDPVLQRGQPLLLQAGANPLAQSVGRRVGERRTAPQLQRRTQAGGPVTGVGRGLGAGEQGPETVDVDPIGRYAQDVALVSGDERDVALPPNAARIRDTDVWMPARAVDGGQPSHSSSTSRPTVTTRLPCSNSTASRHLSRRRDRATGVPSAASTSTGPSSRKSTPPSGAQPGARCRISCHGAASPSATMPASRLYKRSSARVGPERCGDSGTRNGVRR